MTAPRGKKEGGSEGKEEVNGVAVPSFCAPGQGEGHKVGVSGWVVREERGVCECVIV